MTNIPILGEIIYHQTDKPIVITAKSRSAISEQFRLIRTNIQFLGAEKEAKCIMVTSYISGEGKSFVSTNLAASLALTGKKVLLMEYDLRKPKITKAFGMENNIGISNYIVKGALLADIIRPVEGEENLFLLSSGPTPPNPAELILSKKTSDIFEEAARMFDVIVIDTAPTGLVTDALLLEKYADISLFIIRHKYTYKSTLIFIQKMFMERKFKSLSLIVNGIKYENSSGYG